jgi:hypothetical protein
MPCASKIAARCPESTLAAVSKYRTFVRENTTPCVVKVRAAAPRPAKLGGGRGIAERTGPWIGRASLSSGKVSGPFIEAAGFPSAAD